MLAIAAAILGFIGHLVLRLAGRRSGLFGTIVVVSLSAWSALGMQSVGILVYGLPQFALAWYAGDLLGRIVIDLATRGRSRLSPKRTADGVGSRVDR